MGRKIAKKGEPAAFIDKAVTCDTAGCLYWPYAKNAGGCAITSGKEQYVSRIICERVHGPPTPKSEVLHSCGNGHLGCVNPQHLRWGSRKENVFDEIKHRGVFHTAKLSKSDVKRIRQLAVTKSHYQLAKMFGVGRTTISGIVARNWWSWL